MAKKRVYEIAKEKGVSSKDLLEALRAAGIDVKAAASTVDEADAARVLPARRRQRQRPATGRGGRAEAGPGAEAGPQARRSRPSRRSSRSRSSRSRPSPATDGRPPQQARPPAQGQARPQGGGVPAGQGGGGAAAAQAPCRDRLPGLPPPGAAPTAAAAPPPQPGPGRTAARAERVGPVDRCRRAGRGQDSLGRHRA